MLDPRPKTIVYVDGFNLYYGALKHSPHKWLDLLQFADRLVPKNDVILVRYFTARIKPRDSDPQAPSRQQVYLRALGSLAPRLTIHEGQFLVKTVRMALADPLAKPRTVEVIKSEEKGSDVNLATYLMHDAYRDAADAFVVVSNDSDLMEPMRLVKQETGKIVGLVSPYSTNSYALMKCGPDFAKVVRPHHLANSQFTDVVDLGNGRSVRKPGDWWQKEAEAPTRGASRPVAEASGGVELG